jgi:L-rhamnonate dehydratase
MLAASVGMAASSLILPAADDRLKIVSVDAYPIRLWANSTQGTLPKFNSDFDPRRWSYRGPLAQLAGAIMVVIKSDQGHVGFGMGAGGSAAVQVIERHLRNLLIGANPLNIEMLWDQMYASSNAYGRRGLVVMALSGVDNALWDLYGKHADQPVWRLLGGTTKEKAQAYFTSSTPEKGLPLGFEHFKMPVRDGLFEGREGMQRTVDMLTQARRAIGPDRGLMIDCSSRWDDVTYTKQMARRLEDVRLDFIEEPLSPDNVLGYQQLVREVDSTLIASGEHEYTHHGFRMLFHHKAIEVVQPDVTWCGGVTALRRIAAMAHAEGLPFIPHRGGSLFGLPLVLSQPNATLAESFGTGDAGTEVMEAATARFENGYYYPPEGPGFGTQLTEAIIRRHVQ